MATEEHTVLFTKEIHINNSIIPQVTTCMMCFIFNVLSMKNLIKLTMLYFVLQIVIILRGPPGSGKTHVARLIKVCYVNKFHNPTN